MTASPGRFPNQRITASPVDGGGSIQRLILDIGLGWGGRRVTVASDDLPLAASNDALVAVALLPCMVHGIPVVFDGQSSGRLMRSVGRIQEIYRCWDSRLRMVSVHGSGRSIGAGTGRRVGVFFSGGVDSFYTLLKHRREITDIIHVHGFELELGRTACRARVSSMLRAVAAEFGVGVVELETDMRDLLVGYVHWGYFGHGPAMAAIGHVLAPHFERIYISASDRYDLLSPWGSHPVLDPLWSSEAVEFIHDGAEVSRVAKVASIATSDVAMRHLRVCFRERDSSRNCGRCEKCLRTMLNLEVVGAADRCATFGGELDRPRLIDLALRAGHDAYFLKQDLELLAGQHAKRHLYRRIDRIVNGGPLTRCAGSVHRTLRRVQRLGWRAERRVRRFGRGGGA